jgi:DNA-binding HxlR family transcriptional regulator
MAIEAFAKQNCSIARALSLLGERWTVLVLRDLFLGERRFDAIQEHLGVATNVLSDRLSTLVEEGIVERRQYSERPARHEYRLTEKGRDLQPVLLELMKWGDQYLSELPPRIVFHDECGHRTEPVQVCSHCGGELHSRNVHSEPGPGANKAERATDRRRSEARQAA